MLCSSAARGTLTARGQHTSLLSWVFPGSAHSRILSLHALCISSRHARWSTRIHVQDGRQEVMSCTEEVVGLFKELILVRAAQLLIIASSVGRQCHGKPFAGLLPCFSLILLQ